MKSFVSKNLSYQTIVISVIAFTLLNAFVPLNLPSQAETTSYPFKLTITLEKTTYKSGENINVTWILTNIGNETLTLYSSRDDVPDFMVRDVNSNYVFRYKAYIGTYQIIYPIAQIEPGHNVTLVGLWKQIYDGSAIVRVPFKQVPPGTYYASGLLISYTYNVELETPPVRITII